jgi:hypothetical protein
MTAPQDQARQGTTTQATGSQQAPSGAGDSLVVLGLPREAT